MENMHCKYPEFIREKFKNTEVHIVASGPSLLGFDYSKLKGKNIIAVNHAYKMVDSLYCVFVDKSFPAREDVNVIKNSVCLSRYIPEYPSIINFIFNNIFNLDPEKGVYHRRSSGVAALTTALQGGASSVFLWGFDCKFYTEQEARETIARNGGNGDLPVKRSIYGHSTSGMYNHTRDQAADSTVFRQTVEFFKVFPRNSIYNMSTLSVIPYFEKLKIEDVL